MRQVKAPGFVATLSKDCVVFIPFVCRRCGECCRKKGVNWMDMDFRKIGKYLGLTPRGVVEKYLVGDGPSDVPIEEREVRTRPCPFLKGNRCRIYSVRPQPCEAFPIETDFGGSQLCPGYDESLKSWRGMRSYAVQPVSCCSETIHVPPEKWDKILTRYQKTKPSGKALKIFIKVNKPKLSGESLQA